LSDIPKAVVCPGPANAVIVSQHVKARIPNVPIRALQTLPPFVAELDHVKDPGPGLCSTFLVHTSKDFVEHHKAQNQDICVLSSDNNRHTARFSCMNSMEKYR